MTRPSALLLTVALLLGACAAGDDDEATATTGSTPSTTAAPAPTTSSVDPTTAAPDASAPPTSAPDLPAGGSGDEGPPPGPDRTSATCLAGSAAPREAVLSASGRDLVLAEGPGSEPAPVPDAGWLDDDQRTALTAALAADARTTLIRVPAGPGPHPVVVNLHGYGSNADEQSRYSRLADLGATAGYLVVALDGRGATRRWELQATAADPTAAGASDVAVVDGVLSAVVASFCGDPDQVHATGLSNGAVFASVLACHSRYPIRAVGTVSFTSGRAGCSDDRQVPTVAFHGTNDVVVPYAGQSLPLIRAVLGWDLEPAEAAMAAKAELNGCDGVADEAVASDVLRRTWQDCVADTVLYRIERGGHGWPGPVPAPSATLATTDSVDASQLILEFFDQH